MEAMNKLVDCQTEESPLCYHKCAIVRAQPNFLKGYGSAGLYSESVFLREAQNRFKIPREDFT